jgi:hypothetical protein
MISTIKNKLITLNLSKRDHTLGTTGVFFLILKLWDALARHR